MPEIKWTDKKVINELLRHYNEKTYFESKNKDFIRISYKLKELGYLSKHVSVSPGTLSYAGFIIYDGNTGYPFTREIIMSWYDTFKSNSFYQFFRDIAVLFAVILSIIAFIRSFFK